MNKALGATLALVAVAAAAGGGYWFGKAGPDLGKPQPVAARPAPTPAAPPPGPAPIEVLASPVMTESMPQTITAVGSLRSDESVTIRPEVAGRIVEILFQEGQRVTKGAPLIRLDPSINQAETRQARANLTLARSKYERSVELAGRNFISGQAKDEAKNNLDIAQAAVALAEARLARTEIRAPFSGIVGLRSVSVGDYVREGTDIVKLEAIDPLKVDIRVPEVFLREVKSGQPIQVTLDALPGRSYDGQVLALDPLVDAAGRSLVIRAQVRNQDTTMRPGMFARIRLITRNAVEALVLPEEALIPLGTDQFVFRVVDGRANRVQVTTGQRRDGKVEVLSGIVKGDVVVTAGQTKLRPGSPVRIQAAPAGSKPAPDASAPARPVTRQAAATAAATSTEQPAK